MEWNKRASEQTVEKVADALRGRGFEVSVVGNGDDARKRVHELIPDGSEVLEVSSTTLNQIGFTKELEEGRKYVSLRAKIDAIQDEGRRYAARKSLAPEYAIGSVHAITEDGQLLVASASGSQIPPYSFTASHVVLVVGTHKIVKDLDDGLKRLYEYSLPLESERARKAYGVQGSSVNMVLLLERTRPGRVSIVLVGEELGF